MRDGPDLMVAFGIASLGSSSWNYNANRLVALSNGRVACISHLERFETAAFSIRPCLFADDIEVGGSSTAAHRRCLNRSLMERGRPHTGVIDSILEKIGIQSDQFKFLGRINIKLSVDPEVHKLEPPLSPTG